MKERKATIWTKSKVVIIASMGIFLALIILSAVLSVRDEKTSKKNSGTQSEEVQEGIDMTVPVERQVMAVVLSVEEDTITLLDVDTDEEFYVQYSSASNIVDKYDQPILAQTLYKGQMVDVYLGEEDVLVTLQISKTAWEYLAATSLLYNTNAQAIMYNRVKYPYTEGLLVLDGDEEIALTDLHKLDYVTIRGTEDKICVISRTRGHGYIRLTGDSDYIGGIIYVGTSIISEITEDMILTVKEGTFDVTVQKGNLSGTKKITIGKDQTVTFNVSEYGLPAAQMGRVTFEITPGDAILYVDGEETSHKEAVQLTYGEHEIEVVLGGYTTYNGTITVDRTENTFAIKLSESSTISEDDSELEEDSDGSGSWEEDSVITDDNDSTSDSDNEDSSDVTEESSEEETEEEEEPEIDWIEEEEEETAEEIVNGVDKDHKITIICTEGAKVYLDGTYKGTIQGGKLEFTKVVGTYTVELRLDGYDTKSYVIQIEDDGSDAQYRFPGF